MTGLNEQSEQAAADGRWYVPIVCLRKCVQVQDM